jgi:hypothetical protein
MKRLASLLIVLSCTSCLGNYLPKVYIRTEDYERLATLTINAAKNADINGDGIVSGRDESSAFWNNALTAAATFSAPKDK